MNECQDMLGRERGNSFGTIFIYTAGELFIYVNQCDDAQYVQKKN